MTEAEGVRKHLAEALARLASDPVVQIAFLERTEMSIDEFALDFEYAFELLHYLTIPDDLRTLLGQINQKMIDMTAAGPNHWTDAALSGPDWSQLRTQAREALAWLGYVWRAELVAELNLIEPSPWSEGIPAE